MNLTIRQNIHSQGNSDADNILKSYLQRTDRNPKKITRKIRNPSILLDSLDRKGRRHINGPGLG